MIPGALHWVGAICLSCCDSCQLNTVADKKLKWEHPQSCDLVYCQTNWSFCFWLRFWCKTSWAPTGICDKKPEKDFSWINKKKNAILLVHLCKVSENRNRLDLKKTILLFTCLFSHFIPSQYAKLAISLRVPGGGGKKKKAAAAPQGGASGAPAPAEEEDDYEGGLC